MYTGSPVSSLPKPKCRSEFHSVILAFIFFNLPAPLAGVVVALSRNGSDRNRFQMAHAKSVATNRAYVQFWQYFFAGCEFHGQPADVPVVFFKTELAIAVSVRGAFPFPAIPQRGHNQRA